MANIEALSFLFPESLARQSAARAEVSLSQNRLFTETGRGRRKNWVPAELNKAQPAFFDQYPASVIYARLRRYRSATASALYAGSSCSAKPGVNTTQKISTQLAQKPFYVSILPVVNTISDFPRSADR
jgi:hypothetical protein